MGGCASEVAALLVQDHTGMGMAKCMFQASHFWSGSEIGHRFSWERMVTLISAGQ